MLITLESILKCLLYDSFQIKAPNSPNAPSPFYQVSNVSAAKWIWTNNNAGKDIICRREL